MVVAWIDMELVMLHEEIDLSLAIFKCISKSVFRLKNHLNVFFLGYKNFFKLSLRCKGGKMAKFQHGIYWRDTFLNRWLCNIFY
jgi:hypothetical protein